MNETNVKSNQSIQGGQSPQKDVSICMGLPKARIQDDIDASSYLKTSTAESNAIEHIFTEVTDAFATIFTAPSTDNIQSSGVYPNRSINNGRVNATDKNSSARVNAFLEMDVLSSLQELRSDNGTENVSHTNVNEMTLKSKIPLLRKPSFAAKKGPVCKDHSETGDLSSADNKTKANAHASTSLKSKLPLLRKRSAKDDGSSPTCSDSSVASTKVKVPAEEPVSSRLELEFQSSQRKEPVEEPFEEPFEEEEEPPEELNILDKFFNVFFPDYDDATSVSSGIFSFNSDPSESDSDEDEVTDTRDPDEFPDIKAGKPHAAEKKLLRKVAKLKKLRKRLADKNMKKKLDEKDKQIEILCQQLNSTKEELVETMESVKSLSAKFSDVVDSNDKNDKRASVRTAPAAAAQKNVPRSPKKQPIDRVPSYLLTHPSPNAKKYANAWDDKETDDDDHDEALALWYTSTELLALNQAVDCAITIARSQDAASIISEPVSCSTYEM